MQFVLPMSPVKSVTYVYGRTNADTDVCGRNFEIVCTIPELSEQS